MCLDKRLKELSLYEVKILFGTDFRVYLSLFLWRSVEDLVRGSEMNDKLLVTYSPYPHCVVAVCFYMN